MPATGRLTGPRPKSLRYAVHAGAFFTVLGLFRLFRLDTASALGGWLGSTLIAPKKRRRPKTLASLRIAYPDLSEAEADELLTGMYGHLGRMVAEIAHGDDFTGEAGRRRFSFEGVEHIERARKAGRGFLLVTGHFGNWELLPAALRHLGFEASTVTRPPNNPWVAEWIERRRAKLGVKQQIPKGADGLRTLFTTLRRGEAVAMFIDQQLDEGIPAPLFGRDAMTTHAPATLALKLGLPVIPFAIRRMEGANFQVVIRPPVRRPRTTNQSRAILQMTSALNRFIEDEVRLRPEHWLWMHQRWRGVPDLSRRATHLVGEAQETVRAGADGSPSRPAARAARPRARLSQGSHPPAP